MVQLLLNRNEIPGKNILQFKVPPMKLGVLSKCWISWNTEWYEFSKVTDF